MLRLRSRLDKHTRGRGKDGLGRYHVGFEGTYTYAGFQLEDVRGRAE